MDSTTQALLFALLGAVLGAGMVLAWHFSQSHTGGASHLEEPAVSPGVATVLAVLSSSAVLVGGDDTVLQASAPAHAVGLVRGNQLRVPELADVIRQVRRDGVIREIELVVPRADGTSQAHFSARVAPLSSQLVLALLEDRTRERAVEAIRRDFVANVSHELKTPVGAIELLAEAVEQASEDPEAVERFAGRIKTESGRLSRLVQQIIELSRLQGDDLVAVSAAVDVDDVVRRAVEQVSTDAETKNISIVREGDPGLQILGDADQITLALGNLVANAVTYSAPGSAVTVAVRPNDVMVDVAVNDQGIGIPTHEVDRIFERFYRVDPARQRSTGGTGLGLSIVKHVVASHGGEAHVWSHEGEGSTFTLSFPRRFAGVRPSAPDPEAT